MSVDKYFNQKIKRFLKEQPDSQMSSIIRDIEKHSNTINKSYYSIFDNFSGKVGLSINYNLVEDAKSEKIIGYRPYFIFYPNNLFDIPPSTVYLGSAMKISVCGSLLAKEFIYKLMTISQENLNNIITSK